LAKDAEPPARLLGQMAVPIGRFGVSMNLIDTPRPFESLKIRFELSSMAIKNFTTSGVAVGATVLAAGVGVEDRYQSPKKTLCAVPVPCADIQIRR
jgi:hypothetical protein